MRRAPRSFRAVLKVAAPCAGPRWDGAKPTYPSEVSRGMSETFKPAPGDVELVQREECFRGFYRLDRLRLRHRQFDGSMGREISRELFVRHDAVCVLPTTRSAIAWCSSSNSASGRCRSSPALAAGAGRRPDRQGRATGGSGPSRGDGGQADSRCALADNPVPAVAGRHRRSGAPVRRPLRPASVGGVHGLPEGEDIRVHVWPLEDALQAVRDGRINNAASIIALRWLALNRAEVRGLWA